MLIHLWGLEENSPVQPSGDTDKNGIAASCHTESWRRKNQKKHNFSLALYLLPLLCQWQIQEVDAHNLGQPYHGLSFERDTSYEHMITWLYFITCTKANEKGKGPVIYQCTVLLPLEKRYSISNISPFPSRDFIPGRSLYFSIEILTLVACVTCAA